MPYKILGYYFQSNWQKVLCQYNSSKYCKNIYPRKYYYYFSIWSSYNSTSFFSIISSRSGSFRGRLFKSSFTAFNSNATNNLDISYLKTYVSFVWRRSFKFFYEFWFLYMCFQWMKYLNIWLRNWYWAWFHLPRNVLKFRVYKYRDSINYTLLFWPNIILSWFFST